MHGPPPPHPLRANARVLAAALIGTTVEYYDFFIYATAAALVFGPLFFPTTDPAAQTLLAFMSFGIAFIARPVGAAVFGHYGDRIGRKSTLVVALLLMGLSTLGIAFLPTYAAIGWLAPALLCLMRFGQGLGLGGEWGGATLLAVENAPPGWAARFGAAPQLGSPVGFLAANGVFLLLGLALDEHAFREWGWRVPFMASALLVIVGLWIRLRITETREYREALERDPPLAVPLRQVLGHHGGAVVAGAAGVVSTFATFYLTTAYALAQATGPLGYPREQVLGVLLGANVLYAAGIVGGAMLADRTAPARTIALGAIGTAAMGFVFGPALASGSLAVIAAMLGLTMLLLGINNATLGPWLAGLFPIRLRYSGLSVAFNIGGIVGGALTPIAAQGLSAAGLAPWAGLLLTAAGLCTLAGVALGRPIPR